MYDFNPWNAALLIQSLQMTDRGRERRELDFIDPPRGAHALVRRALASVGSLFGRRTHAADAGAATRAGTVPTALAEEALPVRKRQPGRRPAKPLVSADEYRAVSSRDADANRAARQRAPRD